MEKKMQDIENSEHIDLRVTREIRKRIKKAALADGSITMSAWLRRVIMAELTKAGF